MLSDTWNCREIMTFLLIEGCLLRKQILTEGNKLLSLKVAPRRKPAGIHRRNNLDATS